MKLGLETESLHLFIQNGKLDIFQLIKKIYEWGLDGIQINVVKKSRGPKWGSLESLEDEYLGEVKKQLDYYELYSEVDTNSTDPNHLSKMIKVASKLGADVVRTFITVDKSVDESLKEAEENIVNIIPLLKKYQIKLAIENHEYETSVELINLINSIDDENVGVLCDVGNSMMAWEDPVKAVNTLAPYAFSTHFKDHIVVRDNGDLKVCGVQIGTGSINLEECFRILIERSNLSRVNIEMCNPYLSSFKREEGTGGINDNRNEPFLIKEKPNELKDINSGELYYPTTKNIEKLLNYQEATALESIKYVINLRDMLCSKE